MNKVNTYQQPKSQYQPTQIKSRGVPEENFYVS